MAQVELMSYADDEVLEQAQERKESWRKLMRPATAELTASFLLFTLAVGSVVFSASETDTMATRLVLVALSFGFTITVLAFSFGHISGGHMNPAVTIAFVVVRKISWRRGLAYVVAQTIGMCLGGLFLRAIATDAENHFGCFGANNCDNALIWQSLLLEVVLTAMLLLVISAAADSTKTNQTFVPLAIGLAVFSAHMLATPYDGTSINPTRSLASLVASIGHADCASVWSKLWIFYVRDDGKSNNCVLITPLACRSAPSLAA